MNTLFLVQAGEIADKPTRNVTLTVKHTPDVNVLAALYVKNQMWIASQWP